jgi:hypothetical protein
VLIASATLALAGGGGCADGGSGGLQDRIVRTGSEPIVVERGGTLTTFPAPLTLADLHRQPKGSGKRAVLALWFWGQWGSVHHVAAMYNPAVRAKLGASRIADAYRQQRELMISSFPRIVSVKRSPTSRGVTIDVLTTASPPIREHFLLTRSHGRWTVLRDTFVEAGLRPQPIDGAP